MGSGGGSGLPSSRAQARRTSRESGGEARSSDAAGDDNADNAAKATVAPGGVGEGPQEVHRERTIAAIDSATVTAENSTVRPP